MAMQQVSQRHVDALLAKYAESHRHPANEAIHFICIPAIIFSLLGLLWAAHPFVALAFGISCMPYYFMLSPSFAFGMLLIAGTMLGILALLPEKAVLPLALGVFVAAWIGQFVGHKIEGRKPSFFDDLRFLLIGPLFVLGFLYRRLGIVY